jgi:hypothetical protein
MYYADIDTFIYGLHNIRDIIYATCLNICHNVCQNICHYITHLLTHVKTLNRYSVKPYNN